MRKSFVLRYVLYTVLGTAAWSLLIFGLFPTRPADAIVYVDDHKCVWRSDGSADPWCGGPGCQNFEGNCDGGALYRSGRYVAYPHDFCEPQADRECAVPQQGDPHYQEVVCGEYRWYAEPDCTGQVVCRLTLTNPKCIL